MTTFRRNSNILLGKITALTEGIPDPEGSFRSSSEVERSTASGIGEIAINRNSLGTMVETSVDFGPELAKQIRFVFRADGMFMGAESRMVRSTGGFDQDYQELGVKETNDELKFTLRALRSPKVHENLSRFHPMPQINQET